MIVTHPPFADAPALAARLGLKLFPVRLIPGPNGSLNKVPAIRGGHGYLEATDDAAVLTAWAAAYPDAAVGVPCRPNGFIGFDDDSHTKARGILAEWQTRLGALPPTLVHTSIRGGKHLLVQDPGGRLIGKLGDDPGDDCEVKCNGYIVLTSLPDDWRAHLAALPPAWIEAIRKPDRPAAPPNPALHATASEWITTHAHALGITGDAAGSDHTKYFFPCPWIDEHTTGHNDREAALFVAAGLHIVLVLLALSRPLTPRLPRVPGEQRVDELLREHLQRVADTAGGMRPLRPRWRRSTSSAASTSVSIGPTARGRCGRRGLGSRRRGTSSSARGPDTRPSSSSRPRSAPPTQKRPSGPPSFVG